MENQEEKKTTLPKIVEEIGENQIIDQCITEHKLCYNFMRPKINEWLLRLTIYNNQKRDKTKIGDPLLFTVFQTLLAALYEDRLKITFQPREIGDEEVADNLNDLANFDYSEMQKDILDFEWIWDSLFFGRGLVLLQEFDRKKVTPMPQIIDPMTMVRDPRATSINGDVHHYNSARFFGREISLTKNEIEKNNNYFNVGNLRTGEELRSLLTRAQRERRKAQGLAEMPFSKEDDLKDNAQFGILEWYTHLKGKKYLVALGNQKTELIRTTLIKSKENNWPVIDRPLFPIAHDWDGVSVPDLVEDKQRARAILQNLGLESAKSDVYPQYLFDETRIKNRSDLHFGFNKFIRVAGATTGAVEPMHKPVVHTQVSWIMDLLDQSTQRALATPEIQQGIVSKEARTLGELELVSAKVDTRYSLAAKIFGWSEKRFWREWYSIYKNHFQEKIDKKIIRLKGVWGPEIRTLKKENIIAKVDPDIEVESKVVSEASRLRERNAFTSFISLVISDPDINRRFAFRELAKLNGLDKAKIKVLFPPTLDEMEAERENEMIEKKEMPKVEIRQDHQAHLIIHAKLNESEIRDRHIEIHKFAMELRKRNEMLFREMEATAKPPLSPSGAPGPGAPAPGRGMPPSAEGKPLEGREEGPVAEKDRSGTIPTAFKEGETK